MPEAKSKAEPAPATEAAPAPRAAVRTVLVAPADAGMRLDRWFTREIQGLTHGRLQKLLRTGQVRVDGGRVTAGLRLAAGQSIRIPPLPDLSALPPREVAPVSAKDAADLVARVLYRDDDVIAINKPAGIAVQGGTGTERHIDGMLDALRFGSEERPRLVHRLDRDTSGVLLLARNGQSAAALSRAFAGRSVHKTYWALTVGVPEPRRGTIDRPLAKGEGEMGREKMEESEDGDVAITDYRVIDDASRAAWVELSPRTGRTHQLRAHMAAIGTPIAGDRKYGGNEVMLPGIAPKLHLHAAAVSVRIPGRKGIDVEAPLPEHMVATWRLFGFEGATPKKKKK